MFMPYINWPRVPINPVIHQVAAIHYICVSQCNEVGFPQTFENEIPCIFPGWNLHFNFSRFPSFPAFVGGTLCRLFMATNDPAVINLPLLKRSGSDVWLDGVFSSYDEKARKCRTAALRLGRYATTRAWWRISWNHITLHQLLEDIHGYYQHVVINTSFLSRYLVIGDYCRTINFARLLFLQNSNKDK